MPVAYLTRTVRFSAAHRYRRAEWDDARNAAVFGACAHPSYHGHGYRCDVTVRGRIDPLTGFCVDLAVLDGILREEVHERFDHRNLNLDVPEFSEEDGGGREIPTSENLAVLIFSRVQERLGDAVAVVEVSVAEDDSMRVTFRGEE